MPETLTKIHDSATCTLGPNNEPCEMCKIALERERITCPALCTDFASECAHGHVCIENGPHSRHQWETHDNREGLEADELLPIASVAPSADLLASSHQVRYGDPDDEGEFYRLSKAYAEKMERQVVNDPEPGQKGCCYRCFMDGWKAHKSGASLQNFSAGYITPAATHTCGG